MFQIYSKMASLLFSAYFDNNFCYQSNSKNQINTRLSHLGYCSNKLKEEIGESQFIIWPQRGWG